MRRGLLLCLLGALFSVTAGGSLAMSQKVGGPCSYHDYAGRATIVSIDAPDRLSGAKPGHYVVRFLFYPANPDEKTRAFSEGKKFVLERNYQPFMTMPEIEERGVAVGKSFDGTMRIITQGTCTPVLFDFEKFMKF